MAKSKVVGGRLLAVCQNCGKIIRADKPFLGSFHICTTFEEQIKFNREIAAKAREAENALEGR